MGTRRQGREIALKELYREEITGLPDGPIPGIDRAGPDSRSFARSLVEGVREHVSAIDDAIAAASENWDISRMGVVDRSILRIGAFELMYSRNTPVGVVIDEAVEIARKYSTDDCARFVNGVLDKIAKVDGHDETERLEAGDETQREIGG